MKVSERPQEARADWLKEPPLGWTRRLREISPIVDRTSHLRFRYRDDFAEWWLYDCLPAAMVSADRAEQFRIHWTQLPVGEQMGRRRCVTEYQFHMWRAHHVDARP